MGTGHTDDPSRATKTSARAMSATYKIIRDGEEKYFDDEEEFRDLVRLHELHDIEFKTEIIKEKAGAKQ